MDITRCPDCAGDVIRIGDIPATDIFAGQELISPLSGGSLYRCKQCLLGFRWPHLNKEKLDSLYIQGNDQAWSESVQCRHDWRIAQDWIEQLIPTQSRILDIGCFDGRFLELLQGEYSCYGIEIHPLASSCAEQKNIEVVGSDFSLIEGTFDCITAFDVIEHVEKPMLFLNNCLSAVRQDGWVIISTGNLDAFTFRLMGSCYWYCTIAEHISFVSPAWFTGISEALNFRIQRQVAFSHGDSSLDQCFKEAAKNILYRSSIFAFRKLRTAGIGGKNVALHPELADHPPSWMSATDHFIILLQKI